MKKGYYKKSKEVIVGKGFFGNKTEWRTEYVPVNILGVSKKIIMISYGSTIVDTYLVEDSNGKKFEVNKLEIVIEE